MNPRFVSVPYPALSAFMLSRKFRESSSGHERTFVRDSSGCGEALQIVVYSSCAVGADVARECGEDAIRVVLVGRVGQMRGLHKTTRILRTGSVEKVLARVLERCQEAAKAAKEYGPLCPKCKVSITYADSGRCLRRECRDG